MSAGISFNGAKLAEVATSHLWPPARDEHVDGVMGQSAGTFEVTFDAPPLPLPPSILAAIDEQARAAQLRYQAALGPGAKLRTHRCWVCHMAPATHFAAMVKDIDLRLQTSGDGSVNATLEGDHSAIGLRCDDHRAVPA